MNKIAVALSIALALGTSTSVFAASFFDDDAYSNAEYGYSAPDGYGAPALNAYAQAAHPRAVNRSAVTPPAVVVEGQIIGRDPDPTIRSQMERDYRYLND